MKVGIQDNSLLYVLMAGGKGSRFNRGLNEFPEIKAFANGELLEGVDTLDYAIKQLVPVGPWDKPSDLMDTEIRNQTGTFLDVLILDTLNAAESNQVHMSLVVGEETRELFTRYLLRSFPDADIKGDIINLIPERGNLFNGSGNPVSVGFAHQERYDWREKPLGTVDAFLAACTQDEMIRKAIEREIPIGVCNGDDRYGPDVWEEVLLRSE